MCNKIYNSNIALSVIIGLFIYIALYFIYREVKVESNVVTVDYPGYGQRIYILDTPEIDEKLESGTVDITGKPSYLVRLFVPIEIIEMKARFELRHY